MVLNIKSSKKLTFWQENWWSILNDAFCAVTTTVTFLSVVAIDKLTLSPLLSFLGWPVDNHRSGTSFRSKIRQFHTAVTLPGGRFLILVKECFQPALFASVTFGCKKAARARVNYSYFSSLDIYQFVMTESQCVLIVITDPSLVICANHECLW